MIDETHCPLCAGIGISAYFSDKRRSYQRCDRCHLVFVPARFYLDRGAERAEYDLHQNEIGDAGYRAFLSRLLRPLTERLEPGARGLDFGCGPGPALAEMLREGGFDMSLYDSFYLPDKRPLQDQYDFICATEVVEHLHQPGAELARLWALLRPGGWLGIMTKLVRNRAAFANWHYKNDPTHVCFFSGDTWRWWAGQQGAQLSLIGADVILLAKD